MKFGSVCVHIIFVPPFSGRTGAAASAQNQKWAEKSLVKKEKRKEKEAKKRKRSKEKGKEKRVKERKRERESVWQLDKIRHS